jgi:hypothetical protein
MFGVYINLDKRADRRAHIESQLAPLRHAGYNVQRMPATAMPGKGALGCAMSHCRALEAGLESGSDTILVLEDDFQWEVQPSDIDRALRDLPPDYDVLCLSYYLPRACPLPADVQSSKWWMRGCELQTTAGYIVRAAFAREHLLPIFRDAVVQLQNGLPLHRAAIDIMWKQLQLTHKFYMSWPRLARQLADSRSDILVCASATDHGSSGVAIVLHDRLECNVPLVQVRNGNQERVMHLAGYVRKIYPVMSYMCICVDDTDFTPVEYFNFFRQVMSPRSQPRALIGAATRDNKLHGDCIVSVQVVDEFIRNYKHLHYTAGLPAACAALGRAWDKTWPFCKRH